MYRTEQRVRYSESDYDGKLTMDGVLNYFQDCSIFNAEDLNVGTQFQRERGIAWILLTWQIEVLRYPNMGDVIKVGTYPYAFKSAFGYRNFIMESAEGELLARADSLWMLVKSDLTSQSAIPEDMLRAYELENKLPMEYNHKKLVLPKEHESRKAFLIEQHHLDTNHHVNNGQYIRMMSCYLPKGAVICRLKAEYRNQAHLGDTICPMVGQTEEAYVIALNNEQGVPYVVASFRLAGKKDPENGEYND